MTGGPMLSPTLLLLLKTATALDSSRHSTLIIQLPQASINPCHPPTSPQPMKMVVLIGVSHRVGCLLGWCVSNIN